jgi:hypothetical protein
MRRLFPFAGALALAATLAAPSTSYAQQAFNFYVGGFVPRGEDTRDPDDVLVNNLSFLSFNLKDFNGPTIGGEWLVGLGERLDAGLGVGLTSRTVPSVYADFVNSNGSEIEQDLKLRTVPFTATLRFLPLGRRDAFVPYIGAGVGIVAWRYSETGDFVDFSDGSIFRDTFTGTGGAVGPVILGGARFPVGSVDIGGEVRYQNAKGDLPVSEDFAGSKIDLGGFNYLLTFTVKF